MKCFTFVLVALLSIVLVAPPPVSAQHETPLFDRHGRASPLNLWLDGDGWGGRAPTGEGALGGGWEWRSLGPFGGRVFVVEGSPSDPMFALAGTEGGLYRSTDGGATWQATTDPGAVDVIALTIASDGTVYIGTISGLRKSIDGGQSFTAVPLPTTNSVVTVIAVDPNDSDKVWVGLANSQFEDDEFVLRSADAGASWVAVSPPKATFRAATGLAVDPTDSNKVFATFAGQASGDVWFTPDNGASWLFRSGSLPMEPINDVVALGGGRVLIAGGALFEDQDFGVYESTNDGQSWTALHDGSWPNLAARSLTVDPANPLNILVATEDAGVHRSTDGGASWTLGVAGTSGVAVNRVRFVPGSSTDVLTANIDRGIFRSTDGGAQFDLAPGVALLHVPRIVANPLDPLELAAAWEGFNWGTVFTSTDGGTTWSEEPVPATRWDGVGFAPDGTLYALSDGPTTIADEGVYRRNGLGIWSSLGPDQGPVFETDVGEILFSDLDPDQLLVGGVDRNGFTGPTVWRSLDRGATWTKVHNVGGTTNLDEGVTDIEFVAGTSEQLVLATAHRNSGGSTLRSVDGGASWVVIETGLGTRSSPTGICAFPDAPAVFYLADIQDFFVDGGGLYRSDDEGQSWQLIAFAEEPISDVACSTLFGGTLFASRASGSERVIFSLDRGVTFENFGTGLETSRGPDYLELDGTSAPRLLLGSETGGYLVDLALFVDGFESGDVSVWSSVSP